MKTLPIPCPDAKNGCEVNHQASAENIDVFIASHADSCNKCIQGESCNDRNVFFRVRAELKNGRVVGKTDNMTAQIQFNKGRASQMLLHVGGRFAGILEQADGLELEKALNVWLHSED